MRPETIETKIAYASPETCRYSGSSVDCTGRFQGAVLTEESLREVPASTTELYLRNNGIRDLPVGVFDHLTNLRRLDLAFNGLTTFAPGVFDKLTRLEEIDLNFNQLNYLPEGIFDSLTALLSLSLYGNKLNEDTRFVTTSFPPADHSTSVFDHLSNLRVLNLAGNLLGTVPPGLFDNLKSLEVLSLEYSQLHGLDSDTFRELSSLKALNLSENDYRTPFPADLFEHCQQLEGLYFSYVWFDSLPLEVFRNCTHPNFEGPTGIEGATFASTELGAGLGLSGTVGRVDVQDASPAGAPWLVALNPTVSDLAELENLPRDTKELSLRGLGLRTLPAGIFDRFENLQTLDLSANDLRELPPGIFDKLTHLASLSVTHTKLATFPAGGFDRLENLQHLKLSDNRLGRAKLPAGVFDGLTKLVSLDLSNNPLSLESFETPETVFEKPTALRLLSMNWLYFPRVPSGWFDQLTKLEELWFFGNHTKEVPTGMLDNMPELRIVDLATNDLTSLPTGLFDHNPKLEDIWLLENLFAERSAIAGALTPEVRSRVTHYSTWCNPGWHTPPLSADAEFHFADPFKHQVEEWSSAAS